MTPFVAKETLLHIANEYDGEFDSWLVAKIVIVRARALHVRTNVKNNRVVFYSMLTKAASRIRKSY